MQRLRRMDRGTLTVMGVILAIVCFLAVNLFAALQLGGARLDLTANRIYTLSNSTATLLDGIDEPIKLRLYASRLLLDGNPGLKPYAARVREMSGLKIEIISGETEARLSALGLLSALPDADGVMGDLGGGSLELVRLDKGLLGPQATLPLGPLRLNEAEREGEDIGEIVKEALTGLRWLPGLAGRTFYAIGGAWRALARIHQAHIDYRLRVIDGYRVSNQVSVLVRDLKALGGLLDKLVSLGANQVNGLSFEVSKAETLKDDARKEAVANARRRAELLAAAAGAEVGDVVTISEEASFGGPRPMGMRAAKADMVPIEAGTETLEARVTVTWKLK